MKTFLSILLICSAFVAGAQSVTDSPLKEYQTTTASTFQGGITLASGARVQVCHLNLVSCADSTGYMLEGQIQAYYASDYTQKVVLDSIPSTFKFYMDSTAIKAVLSASGIKDSVKAKIESGMGSCTEIE